MTPPKTLATSKSTRIFCSIGSLLLLVMAVFHGSGFFYVSEAISTSNAEGFLKDIVPALFAHPSIHLIGLSAFGVLAIFLRQEVKKVTWLLALLISLDGALAFYLGGSIPGILLFTAGACFVYAGLKAKVVTEA